MKESNHNSVYWYRVSYFNNTNEVVLFNHNWKFFLGDGKDLDSIYFDDAHWQDVNLPHDFSLQQSYTPIAEAESGYKPGGIGWYRKNFIVSDAVLNGRVIVHFDGSYMLTSVYINGQFLGEHTYGYTPFSFDLTDYVKPNEENVLAVKVTNPIPSSRWYSGSGIYRDVHLKLEPFVHLKEYGVNITTPYLESEIRDGKPLTTIVTSQIVNVSASDVCAKVKISFFEKGINSVVSDLKVAESYSEICIDAYQELTHQEHLAIVLPKLWSIENPYLYSVKLSILIEDREIFLREFDTGFRYVTFDSQEGMFLNGNIFKLKGVCLHHDQGALGAAAHADAIGRQLVLLKDMGVNSIRMAHSPASRVLKTLANRLGLFIIDEAFDTWVSAKNGNINDYAKWFNDSIGNTAKHLIGAKSNYQKWYQFHLSQMVKSGLNDPAIFMWSVGNELMEGHGDSGDNYPSLMQDMISLINSIDHTRPITFADNKLKIQHPISIQMAETLHKNNTSQGIVGYNYANGSQYDSAHKENPDWIIYGSETASSVNSRGVYNVKGNHPREDMQLSSYDQSTVSWGHLASEAWYDTIIRDFVLGEFVWTGFDYLGEPTPWNGTGTGAVTTWPAPKHAYFGIVDTAGMPKDSYYFYRSQWQSKDITLHVLPAWEESEIYKNEDDLVEVVVYTNADKVQLLHVDKDGHETDLGTKGFVTKTTQYGRIYRIYEGEDQSELLHKNLYLTWCVQYIPGTIKAIAYDQYGNEIKHTVGRHTVSTVEKPYQLKLKCWKKPETATPTLIYIEISIQDKFNRDVTYADNEIYVEVTGPAMLIGLDNGNAVDHTLYGEPYRRAFSGKLVAIVQLTGASGSVNVTAHSDSLISNQLTFIVDDKREIDNLEIEYYQVKKFVTVKKGDAICLPNTVTVKYKNGIAVQKSIVFNNQNIQQGIQQEGSFRVQGYIEGLSYAVPIVISVIDPIVAMKNISVAIEVGDGLNLPEFCEGYLADGRIALTKFLVKWQIPTQEILEHVGIISVYGEADVLGSKMPITAWVRKTPKKVLCDQDVAASVVRLITDTGVSYNSPNNASQSMNCFWTNKSAIQARKFMSTITFGYDTVQNIYHIIIYYWNQGDNVCLPQNVSFSWSQNDLDEQQIIAANAVSVESHVALTKVVYELDQPVPALNFNIHIQQSNASSHAYVVVDKISLYTAVNVLPLETSASLDAICVANETIVCDETTRNLILPHVMMEDIVTVSHHNVAVTILPEYNGEIKIMTESEDTLSSDMYVIHVSPK